jgi:hypothetical protein
VKIATKDLKGKALDFAVLLVSDNIYIGPDGAIVAGQGSLKDFCPSEDSAKGWAITGPILSQHRIQLDPSEDHWWGFKRDLALDNTPGYSGDTILADQEAATAPEAILRCFVQWKLGAEVEIPDEVNLKINGGTQ